MTVWPLCLCRRAQRRPRAWQCGDQPTPPSCTDGLGVCVDLGWVACPPTQPAKHTPGIPMRTERKGTAGEISAVPVQNPLRPRPPVRNPLELGLVAMKCLAQPGRILHDAPNTCADLEVAASTRNATSRGMQVKLHPLPAKPAGPDEIVTPPKLLRTRCPPRWLTRSVPAVPAPQRGVAPSSGEGRARVQRRDLCSAATSSGWRA